MDAIPSKGKLKILRVFFLVSGLITDFGMLFYFKYTKFFIELINPTITSGGGAPISTDFDLLMPLGISFFIFTSTGYQIGRAHV